MKSIGVKILVAVLVLVIIAAGVLLGIKFMNNKDNVNETEEQVEEAKKEPEIKEPQIFKGTDRPIAVMIDNHIQAMPQVGLNSAYLIYEIIVEGGQTRMMALYKGVDLEKIGPLRSSRHYFLDYALENDAIYVHWGWSPKAQSDISSLKVQNINGGFESSTAFWRDKEWQRTRDLEHTGVTSTKSILEVAKRKGYTTTSTKKSVLNYVGNEFELDSKIDAKEVTIPYSTSNTVKYEYDETTKRYTRYSRNKKQVDATTDEALTVKNIIITKCKNWSLNDGENKGRQDIGNVGTLEGYYITNGKAIKITAEKSSRTAQTVYKDLEGNEIKVNDGNTFIQICPIDSQIEIEPGEVATTETTTNTVNQ